jgi:hypothetical protein
VGLLGVVSSRRMPWKQTYVDTLSFTLHFLSRVNPNVSV